MLQIKWQLNEQRKMRGENGDAVFLVSIGQCTFSSKWPTEITNKRRPKAALFFRTLPFPQKTI